MVSKLLAGLVALLILIAGVFVWFYYKDHARHGVLTRELDALSAQVAAKSAQVEILEEELRTLRTKDAQITRTVVLQEAVVRGDVKHLSASRKFTPQNLSSVQIADKFKKLSISTETGTITFSPTATSTSVAFPVLQAEWLFHYVSEERPADRKLLASQGVLISSQRDLLNLRLQEVHTATAALQSLHEVCDAQEKRVTLLATELDKRDSWWQSPEVNLLGGVIIGGLAVSAIVAATKD